MRESASHQQPSRLNIVGMVLSHPRYAVIATITTIIVLVISFILPKLALLRFILTFPGYTVGNRLHFFTSTFFSFEFFPTLRSKIMIIVLSLLTGVYVSMLWYFFTHRIASYRAGGLGVVGITISLIGIGCAACGSVVLVTIIGFSATSALLSMLPYKGAEISIVGVLILIASLYFIAGKIRDPFICKM